METLYIKLVVYIIIIISREGLLLQIQLKNPNSYHVIHQCKIYRNIFNLEVKNKIFLRNI